MPMLFSMFQRNLKKKTGPTGTTNEIFSRRVACILASFKSLTGISVKFSLEFWLKGLHISMCPKKRESCNPVLSSTPLLAFIMLWRTWIGSEFAAISSIASLAQENSTKSLVESVNVLITVSFAFC
jgi:hypothetical protein